MDIEVDELIKYTQTFTQEMFFCLLYKTKSQC